MRRDLYFEEDFFYFGNVEYVVEVGARFLGEGYCLAWRAVLYSYFWGLGFGSRVVWGRAALDRDGSFFFSF